MTVRPVRLLTGGAFAVALIVLFAFVHPASAASYTATPANYYAVTAAMKPGDDVTYQAGNYGAVSLYKVNFAAPGVTIKAAPGAVLGSLVADTSSGMTWRGFEVTGLGSNKVAVTTYSGVNLRFEAFHVHGPAVPPGSFYDGSAFSLRDSSNVAVVGSEIDHLGSGVGFQNGTGVTISGNNLHDMAVDGIIGGANNVVIDGNTFTTFSPPPDAHPDAIQWFGAPQTLTITNNQIRRGAGQPIQGIFGEQGANVIVRGNAMSGTMFNGISLSAVSGADVGPNFVQGWTDMCPTSPPQQCFSQMVTRDGSTNVKVHDNTAQGIGTIGTNPGYVAVNNTIIPPAAPGDYTAMNAWIAQHGGPTPPIPPICPVDPQIAILKAQVAALTAQNAALSAQVTSLQTQNAMLTTTVANDTAAFNTIRAALPR